ncbi:hypothetical protein AGMMS50212_06160 [Spirochaetia bacterium]|nr:hypothetical protein AGMMS50212_06160 [Spirochaetia bacterium]
MLRVIKNFDIQRFIRIFSPIWQKIPAFIKKIKYFRLTLLAALCVIALIDFLVSGWARRTAVFFDLKSGKEVVEERLLSRTHSREMDITRYVEEIVLGPSSMENAPLLNKDSALNSVLLRDNTVYLGLSQEAAIHAEEGVELKTGFKTIEECLKRNFPFVKNIRIFIDGNEIFFDF